MRLLDELKEQGVDVDEGTDRMMGNVDLYQKMLVKLREMVKEFSFESDGGDYSGLTERVHKIKGAAGNLSVTPLYKAYAEMLALLREGKPEQAETVYREALPVQEKIMACIEKFG